ncbi:MAG: hypothetical protein GY845_29685 [Planctomycetes bacterium]|nr:hypothetical protein [Planctomycetota bacterium]
MSKTMIYFIMVLSFCFVSSVNAANIIWVSDWYDELADGVSDDQKFVEVLEAHGHTVDNQEAPNFGEGYWRTMDADKIAALNAADLVIVSRNSNSGDYDDDNEIDQWNSITTPMIVMTPYFTRSSRWLWVDNTSLAGDGSTPTLQAVNAAHPVFIGVNLDTKNQVDIFDQTVGSGTVSFYDSIDVGNGTLIATPVDQERTIIAEWEAGVEFYSGSGLITAGRRMLLFMGTREGVGFGRGEYNLNAEGEKIFLNSVDYMLGILRRFKAHSPMPAEGTLHTDTWVNINWSVGDTAVSHDVYFGDNFNDVNDGTAETLLGNQTTTLVTIGFPGFAIPDGLVPGTTYYWRVDEVEADDATKHKGDVWSFLVPPKKAYNPVPLNGAKFIDQNVDLEWSPGSGAKLHTVYFGDNFDDVNDAAGGQPKVDLIFDPGSLEIGKLYYWRVDEDDLIETHKGDVWSFTTIRPGGGIRAQYYRGSGLGGSPVINTKDAGINFNWAGDSPDTLLDVESFSVRWTGELEVEFSEAYTFYANTDDGVRLWVNDQLIIDRWVDRRAPTEAKGTVELTGGQRVPFVMEYYESGGDAVAELRWESPSLPKQIIPDAAFSLPVKASGAIPSPGAVDVTQTPVLEWGAGDFAASHEVYFGTDADAVKNADTSSAQYKGSRNLSSESYDPGQLEWNATYYWRVDEVNNANADSPWTGNVWSFTTANFLIVDDMESYNDINEGEEGSNRIYLAWADGFDNPAVNGSIVGNFEAPFAERTIIHSGNQSMPFEYNNAVGKSEATLTLTDTRNWTVNGVNRLVIWYIGDAANAAEPMYVVLNGSAVVINNNPNAAQVDVWTEWSIDLQAFADQGVNLSNVTSITIGLGNRNNPVAGGAGMLYFDDIRLYAP